MQLKVVLLKPKLTILQLSLLPLFTAAALVDALPELFKNKLIFLHNAVGATLSCTNIVLDTVAKVLPHMSVAVQVSCTCPLQFPETITFKVELLEVPVIRHPPERPFVNGLVLALGNKVLHFTVMSAGVEMVGSVAGLTVINLVTGASVRPQGSVAVQVSVIVPPQAPAGTCALKVEPAEVPDIKQPPPKLLLNGKVLDVGAVPQTMVEFAGAVIVGNAAGLTVINLVTGDSDLPQASVAVQVSIIVPPHAPAGLCALKVEPAEVPDIKQPTLKLLLNGNVLDVGVVPQAMVEFAGAVIVGNAAGLTVINLVTGTSVLPQASVAVQVSVIVPPQAPAGLCALKVEVAEVPNIKQPLLKLLLKVKVLAIGVVPQVIIMVPGAVIVGRSARLTVIILVTDGMVLPHASTAVQVSITVPPQAPAGL